MTVYVVTLALKEVGTQYSEMLVLQCKHPQSGTTDTGCTQPRLSTSGWRWPEPRLHRTTEEWILHGTCWHWGSNRQQFGFSRACLYPHLGRQVRLVSSSVMQSVVCHSGSGYGFFFPGHQGPNWLQICPVLIHRPPSGSCKRSDGSQSLQPKFGSGFAMLLATSRGLRQAKTTGVSQIRPAPDSLAFLTLSEAFQL